MTAIDAPDLFADAPGDDLPASQREVLAIPLVGGGDLAGVLELDPGARTASRRTSASSPRCSPSCSR